MENGVRVLLEIGVRIGVKMVSSFLSSIGFNAVVVDLKDWWQDWCRPFWKIIILLPGNFK